jgi:tripartite-type tricarboxylate transporter receptor subunit TctC
MKLLFILILSIYTSIASASEKVTLIIPTGPGGLNHKYALEIQPVLEKILDANIIIDFQPGANGLVAAQTLARNTKSEITLLLSTPQPNFGVDLSRDIVPVLNLGSAPTVVATRKNLGYRNLNEFIKANKLVTFGVVNGSAQVNWLNGFKASHNIDITEVQYKSGAVLLSDLVGEHVDMGTPSLLGAYSLYEAGKIEILAVLSTHRSTLLPNIPTANEQGVKFDKDVLGYTNLVLWSNPNADPKVIKKLQQEYLAFAKSAKGKELYSKIDLAVNIQDITSPQILLRHYTK